MKRSIAALLLIGSLSAPSLAADNLIEAQAEAIREIWQARPEKPVPINVPLSERNLRFNLPFGYVPVSQTVQGDVFVVDYLPDGQTLDDWQSKVSVTEVYGGADGTLDHATQADQLYNSMTGCESGLYYRHLGERQVHPDMNVAIINRSCAKVVGSKTIGAQSLILHFRTARDTFSLQFTTRRPFRNGKRPFDDEDVARALASFGTITLCPQTGPCEGALQLP